MNAGVIRGSSGVPTISRFSTRAQEIDMRLKPILLTAAAVAAAGCGSASAEHPTPARSAPGDAAVAAPPPLPPAHDFVRVIDNPWFPLRPGTVLTSKGEDGGTPATDILRVTHRV
jgi:hypothetical protein